MNELYELKEMLCKELKEYGKDGSKMSTGSLDTVDKLAHAIKNIDRIIDAYEDEGHSGHYPYWAYDGEGMRSNRGSYAQRRDSRGRYSNRYSRDGYSRDGGMVEELRELMQDAPDERTRQEFQRFISKIESM